MPKQVNKLTALTSIENYINSLTEKKANIFCHWMEDYITYLEYENSFRPQSLKRYKRGDVIKVNLGFNVGSEEGGLHYCVVLEKDNSINNPLVTVAPLTSQKSDKTHYFPSELPIHAELHDLLSNKIKTLQDKIEQTTEKLLNQVKNDATDDTWINQINLQLSGYLREKSMIVKELLRMKHGSIVLLGQITTISKIRIFDPKTKSDVLAGIRLSSDTLDKIDEKIKTLYTKCD